MKEVLEILNPARTLNIEDWMTIAGMKIPLGESRYPKTIQLLHRYEQLASRPLVKEMFVNQFEKPEGTLWDLAKTGDS